MNKNKNNNSQDYAQFILEANSFNKQLILERRQRLPFIDTQTGIAQTDCSLWRTEKDRDPGGGGHLYSYPAHRWQKRRREYLLKRQTRPSSDLSRSASSASSSASSSSSSARSIANEQQHQQQQQIKDLLQQSPSSRSLLAGTPQHHHQHQHHHHHMKQQQPSDPQRADSTGSHSFVDSDSRDQSSSATSQSVDSPRSHHPLEDEHASTLCLGAEDTHDEQDHHDYKRQVKTSGELEQDHDGEDHKHQGATRSNTTNKRSSRSILVKNGRKTTQDNNHSAGIKSTDCQDDMPNGAGGGGTLGEESRAAAQVRPHVCPICDQTYKTRPGLSYHFIHVHDTILPKRRPQPSKQTHICGDSTESASNLGDDNEQERLLATSASKKLRVRGASNSDEATTTRVLRNSRSRAKLENDCSEVATTNDRPPPLSPMAIAVEFQEPQPAGVESTADDRQAGSSPASDSGKSGETIIGEETAAKVDQVEEQPPDPSGPKASEREMETEKEAERRQNGTKGESKQNLFCDFCLGTSEKNRRTRQPEELISCSSCGSSGHPSCLQFSDNIRQSVQKYNWQCIDCKTCSTCGKADHEDQLLFCDDCDRSYHTFCLTPRLENLPEGHWTCKLCLSEYYNGY